MRRFLLSVTLFVGVAFSAPLFAQDLSQPFVPDQVLLRFVPGTTANERAVLRQALSAQGGRPLNLVNGLEVVRTGLDVPQALAVLANNPNVLYAEPDYILQPVGVPNDPHFGLQWGLHNAGQDIRGVPGYVDADIDMPEAWETILGSQTIVAIIDTGTQWNHEDLADNIWVNTAELNGTANVDDDVPPNGFVDDVRGWDFFSDDNDPTDGSGHGTHTAGTVGAVRDNGKGVAGVCGGCRLMPLRFLGPAGGSTSDAISAIGYAVFNGATVSNNSWGGGAFSQALYDAIEAAGNAGHVFVAAAGNSGLSNDAYPDYPSAYDLDNIISVAATDNVDQLANFSNYGAASVDLGAPGVDIASTYWDPSTSEDDYWWNYGTSMAAPHVAGVVALVQESPAECSEADTVARVLRSVRTVDTLAGLTKTGGVLNTNDAVNCTLNLPWPLPTPPVPPGPPAAPPDDLGAVDSTNGSVLLTWTGVADATYYLIEREERRKNGRRIGGDSFWDWEIGGDPETYGDVTEVGPYLYYRIAAGNGEGNTVMSAWVHATVADPTDPDPDSGGSGRCHPKKGC